MIKINLLPEELRKEEKKVNTHQISLSKIPLKRVAIIASALFLLLHALGATTLLLKKNSLEKLNIHIKELEPKYDIAQALKLNVRQMNGKLTAIHELASESILWSKKMSDLNLATTDGVWLSELSLQNKGGSNIRGTRVAGKRVMVLKGSAASQSEGGEAAIIGNFINSLRSHKGFFSDFEDIKLESSKMRQLGEAGVMDFSIICYFNSKKDNLGKSNKSSKAKR